MRRVIELTEPVFGWITISKGRGGERRKREKEKGGTIGGLVVWRYGGATNLFVTRFVRSEQGGVGVSLPTKFISIRRTFGILRTTY